MLLGVAGTGSVLVAAQADPLALTGGQEVPAVETAGIAGAMAHIHMAPTGTNGPPIVTLEKRGENGWVVPAGTHLTAEQYANYKLGGLYVNVHSAMHTGGELRLQLAGR